MELGEMLNGNSGRDLTSRFKVLRQRLKKPAELGASISNGVNFGSTGGSTQYFEPVVSSLLLSKSKGVSPPLDRAPFLDSFEPAPSVRRRLSSNASSMTRPAWSYFFNLRYNSAKSNCNPANNQFLHGRRYRLTKDSRQWAPTRIGEFFHTSPNKMDPGMWCPEVLE